MPDASTGFLRHFHACNQRDLDKFCPFFVHGQQYGWILKALIPTFLKQDNLYLAANGGLELNPEYDSFKSRSAALAATAQTLSEHYGVKLRNEMYPIIQNWGDNPLAEIDRAAVPWLGVKGFGIHVNGYVQKSDGIHLWIGERATDRLIDPGKLDNMVGGGQPIGLTLLENLCKEAEEEAGLPAEIALQSKEIRPLQYMVERHNGLRNDVLFIYDFHLLPIAEVAALVHDTDRFKFNCSMVIADFLMRHGFLQYDHPEYADLQAYIGKPAIA